MNQPNASKAQVNEVQASAGPPVSPLLMPWFFSASWVPKFSGERQKFEEWQTQMKAMLRAHPLNAQQQVDFVMSTLDGEVR